MTQLIILLRNISALILCTNCAPNVSKRSDSSDKSCCILLLNAIVGAWYRLHYYLVGIGWCMKLRNLGTHPDIIIFCFKVTSQCRPSLLLIFLHLCYNDFIRWRRESSLHFFVTKSSVTNVKAMLLYLLI